MSTSTRYEKEAKGNSEMAYYKTAEGNLYVLIRKRFTGLLHFN